MLDEAERDWYARLGRKVRACREVAGMTQDQLAWAAEMSEAHLSRCETGRAHFSTQHVLRVAAALGVKPAMLLPPPLR